tara:strand:+ start:736 stop:1119 length:384 start_codon:yes stop_codon:yes gene_type:complete
VHKLSAAQVDATLRQTAQALRGSAEEIAYLHTKLAAAEAKLASRDQDDRISKVAQAMHDKGLNGELTLEEKVAMLKRPENVQRLDVIEEGVGLAAQQVKLAHIEADSHGIDGGSDAATANFVSGILE